MQTVNQAEHKNMLLIFTNSLLDVQRIKRRKCVSYVCVHVLYGSSSL